MWWILGSVIAAIWLFGTACGIYGMTMVQLESHESSYRESAMLLFIVVFWPVVLLVCGVVMGTLFYCLATIEMLRR
jgi:heme/copper-type cytochrome/quinol oxidase subunit 2